MERLVPPAALAENYASPAPTHIPGNYWQDSHAFAFRRMRAVIKAGSIVGPASLTLQGREGGTAVAAPAYCFFTGAIVGGALFFAAGAGLFVAACAGRYLATMAGSTSAMLVSGRRLQDSSLPSSEMPR